ncbi:hypothetical protein [Mesorhizobium sp. SP-1A]|uniref:hypothetical protein n=1 Tax=Mesorhizobium sp. SP-1A TaxID=3077840 RepID=UPI0028F74BDA|nr:hypothetical protein [Mesorhizobium sp. SP-1A]
MTKSIPADRAFNDDEIGVRCLFCAHETRKTVGWIRAHTQMECPACGTIVDIESKNFRVGRIGNEA